MKAPAIPARESERQRELDATGLLDTAPETEFDEITEVIAGALGVPIALVSLVDRDRQWFKSAYGLNATETPRSLSFCAHVVASEQPLVVADARCDERFSDNPFVLDRPNVVFYAGAPIHSSSGFVLGTLCVIDHQPRSLSDRDLALLSTLARQVSLLIRLRAVETPRDPAPRADEPSSQANSAGELEGYRRMFERSSDLVLIADSRYRVEHVNPAWERVLGWPAQALYEQSFLHLVHPDDAARVESLTRSLLEMGSSVTDFESRLHCADGSFRRIAWSATVSDARFVATGRDVTDSARQQHRNERKNRVLRAIARAQSEFIETRVATPDWWSRVLESLVDATDSNYGFVATIDASSSDRTLQTRALLDLSRASSRPRSTAVNNNNNDARVSVAGLATLAERRAHTDPPQSALELLPEGHPTIRSLLVLPCGAGESLVGAIVLANRAAGYDAAMIDELSMVSLFVESVVHQLASVAERSAAEARLEAVFNSTMDGIVTIDERGTIVSVNAAVERLFGYDERETVGRNAAMLLVTDPDEPEGDVIARYLATGHVSALTRGRSVLGRRKDGSNVPIELNLSEFVLNGTRYFTATLRDVTERVAADRALRQTAEQLANALQIARAGHWEYDVARDRFSFNDNFYRIFRTSVDVEGSYEMSSAQYALRFVHPEDAILVAAEIQAALRSEDPNYRRHLEHRFLYADGSTGHLAVHFFAQRDEQQRLTHIYGVNQDITERRQRDDDREAIVQQRRLNQELADKIAELDRSQTLSALTSQCVELVQRCVSLSEGVEVIARFVERMFPGANVALYTQSVTSEELALRAQYQRAGADPLQPVLEPGACWALRTRRVYCHWTGGIHLPCAHCGCRADELTLCGPLLCLDRVYGLLSVALPSTSYARRDEASVKGTTAQFEAVVQSLSGALSSISLRESLQRLALVDELTGLPNRRAFSTAAQRVFSRRRRTGEPVAVAMFDIDHFKKINDTFGHEEGDRVLQRIAGELTSFFRAEDVIGRLGGEEFAVVLAGITVADAERRLDAFRQNVRDRCALRGAAVTVSAGFVHSDLAAFEGLEHALRDADSALYAAKRAGRDRVVRALAVVA